MELDDKPRWTETKSGDFSIKAMYKVLEARPSIAFHTTNVWSFVFNQSYASLHEKQIGEIF